MNSDLPKVIWLTNVPAPYRFGIWNRLANFVELKVVFVLKEQNWRNWPSPVTATWRYQYLSFSSMKFGEFHLIPNFLGAKKVLKGFDTVVVGGWESPMFMRVTFLAKKKGMKVVHFYESTLESHRFNNMIIRTLRKLIFSRADLVVTPGRASTEAVLAMGIAQERIVTLFNPVDVAWFYDHSRSRKPDTTPGHKYVFVGQLITRKNVSALINAFASIREESDSLTIVGEGPEESNLIELISDLGLEHCVKLVGHKNQHELVQLYAIHSTLILPSTNEVWGLVVNEALACGMQVVVSNKCGVADFVKDMDGVVICDPSTSSISRALSTARSIWKGSIVEPDILKFTPEAFAEELLSLITKM